MSRPIRVKFYTKGGERVPFRSTASWRRKLPYKTGRRPRGREQGPMKRRGIAGAPKIFVEPLGPVYGKQIVAAHLRQRGQYVYLCWREEKRVKTFYLGKRKQFSPTRAARGPAGAGDVA